MLLNGKTGQLLMQHPEVCKTSVTISKSGVFQDLAVYFAPSNGGGTVWKGLKEQTALHRGISVTT